MRLIILNNSKVILSKFKGDNELKNHYMITSFEVDEKVLRELETIAPLSNTITEMADYSISNLKPNSTTNALNTQVPKSPLEQAEAEKLAKLESEKLESEKEFTRLKEQEQARKAALKYHIKRALERSHSISDFSKNLELSAQNAKFSNNTLKIIEELNNGVKQASEELKEATKPSNLVKSIREQDTRHFEVIEDKEAFFKDLNKNLEANATLLPKGMSVEEFKKSLESVENKDRFLEHLKTRADSDERLAALNLVEPILREPHIEIFIKDKDDIIKKEYIKAFKDENKARLYMLITQDNDTILRTFITDTPERYVRNHVRNADIIHSFIQPNRTAKSDNALSDVVVYGENTTKKPLTSQEELLKTSENLNETTQEAKNLSPLEQAEAEKLAKLESEKLESEKEFTRLKEQEQARKAALKYHIKRVLERSHSISDFSKQLELSAKNSKFSNNTLKIIEELNNGVKQASVELKEKARDLEHAITPLKEFGKNYPEFALKPKEALEKLLQEKNGQVAGAAFRDDLGGIDFVWGNKDYGLEHILKKREKQYIRLGLNAEQIKERTDELLKSIPEVIEKGTLFKDDLGRISVELNNIRVGLKNTWDDNNLNNHFMVTSYERDKKVLRELETNPPLSNDYKGNSNYSALNLNKPNPTQKPLSSQEDLLKTQKNTQAPLSPLEQANAKKLAKLESERLASEKEFTRLKEQENARKAALKKKLEHERGNAGNIESATKIQVGDDIPTHTQAQIPKSRVRLNEREIYDLDYAIVKAKDLKPSFTTGGTQKRTDMNEEQIKSIAENFDPKKIFGSGGFEDLPIILHDGQVIAGNHRIQGMLNFTPKSRFIYDRAIKEYYHINLKPDELLVRIPNKRLNNTEINNLAASSNQGRFNSESDHAIAVLSHYEPKLKELEKQLNADSIYSLKNIVAKNLNFDKATHPNVGDSNLALLMYNMPRTKTQGIELLNRWQKEFSNDIKSYEKVKKCL